ncbi:winged helix-turn-helix domain-containing protein [Kitasatospora sp. NPDC127059]|uniref:winged helix-turn-helix domain-containing protein n=1 Tax=unclassified Kitasatospora TaxID=2633591 RepID=UPI0036667C58
MTHILTISRAQARRLAITRQHLSAARPPGDADGVRAVCRSLRFLQLDPVRVIARSHELVLWSRLGADGLTAFDDVFWQDRWLFEYWAHAAAIVLSEDYPLHRVAMDSYPWRGQEKVQPWIDVNHALRAHILERLGEGQPLPTDAFEDLAVVDWPSSGWTNGRNVERMLGFLWRQGIVLVAGRTEGRRLWGLAADCLPADVTLEAMEPTRMVTAAVEHSLRARGIARAQEIGQYFVPGRYVDLPGTLDALTAAGRVVPVRIEDCLPSETWYVHADALDELDAIRSGDWEGRTALLSPFDNMINDRNLTELLWSFEFRNEMYVPKAQRKYAHYVLPVLHGDEFVGRLAPKVDRRRRVLTVEGLWLEPSVKPTAALRRAITAELTDLAGLVGAKAIEYAEPLPGAWRAALLGS